MTEPTPTYQTDTPEPPETEQQAAAFWYVTMQQAHEVGLMAQRQLEMMNALPEGHKLFLTRRERRNGPPE